jgi:hypothetical protein
MNLLYPFLLLFTLQATASTLPEFTQELSQLEITHNDYLKDLQQHYNPIASQIKYLNNENFTLNIIITHLNTFQPDQIINQIIQNYSNQIKLNNSRLEILSIQVIGEPLTMLQRFKLMTIDAQQEELDEDLLNTTKILTTEELSPAEKRMIVKNLKTTFGLRLMDDHRGSVDIANYIINSLK